MSISFVVSRMQEGINEAREQGGEEAAHRQLGAVIGMPRGSLAGAAIGSIAPVIDTGIGFVFGDFWGGLKGLEDRSGKDNLIRVAKESGRAALGARDWIN